VRPSGIGLARHVRNGHLVGAGRDVDNQRVTANAADRDVATRRLYVATVLAGLLVDRLDELERFVAHDSPELRGRVDDLARLAAALHADLVELKWP
jgi:hypothetical protein